MEWNNADESGRRSRATDSRQNGFFRYKSGEEPEGEERQRAKERDHDRVSHPQPDGRARQAEGRGVMNEGLGKRPDSRQG